jgi:hypothetical protein
MASAGGGAAGEGEWLKVAELRAAVQAQDPRAKVSGHELSSSRFHCSSFVFDSSAEQPACSKLAAAAAARPPLRLVAAAASPSCAIPASPCSCASVSSALACLFCLSLMHVNYILDTGLPSLLLTAIDW